MSFSLQASTIDEEGSVQEGEERWHAAAALASAPSAPASQFPSREGGAGKLRGKALWSAHARRVTLAQALIRHLRTEPGVGGGDDDDEDEDGFTDISACENLLESYFAQVPPAGCGPVWALIWPACLLLFMEIFGT